jgi:hypothetical protein
MKDSPIYVQFNSNVSELSNYLKASKLNPNPRVNLPMRIFNIAEMLGEKRINPLLIKSRRYARIFIKTVSSLHYMFRPHLAIIRNVC